MPVREMLQRIDSRELTEWMAYYELEPFGAMRGDLHAGIIASTIANTHRDPKQRKQPFEPGDFMPDFAGDRRPQPQSWQQQLQMVEALNRAFGGTDRRKETA